MSDHSWPTVDNAPPLSSRISVLIAAYNEEAVIAARLENLLGLEYPADRLRLLVGVDGGTDRTAEIVRHAAARDPRLRRHARVLTLADGPLAGGPRSQRRCRAAHRRGISPR